MCSILDLLLAWVVGASSVGGVVWFVMDWELRRCRAELRYRTERKR